MAIFIILISGFIFVLVGRWIFGKWFNHVSLYAGIWSCSLALFEMRLINYYPLETETWIIILYTSMTFVLGAITVSIVQRQDFQLSLEKSVIESRNMFFLEEELRYLNKILWVLNIVTLFAALHTWSLVINRFGSIQNVLIFGNYLYSYRISEGIPGSIPYVSSLSLTATLLAGVYTAKMNKITLVAMLPILIVVIVDMASMGRAMMIIAALIFMTGYFLAVPDRKHMLRVKRRRPAIRIITVVIAISLLVLGGEFVRSLRRANELLPGASQSLLKLRESSFITPSIYMYLTVHHGVLNQYLKQDIEQTLPASNTFAPLFRMLEKFGFDTHVETYQKSYNTPIGANTGTYIRDFHADFKTAGILFGPYIIGFITSIIWFSFQKSRTYVRLALLGYFVVIVGMSLFYNASRAGYLFVYLIGSVLIGFLIDKKMAEIKNSFSGS